MRLPPGPEEGDVIEPETPTRFGGQERFNRVATGLIGVVAVLAAILAILQVGYGQASSRAQVEAARLETDVSARVSASSLARDAGLRAQQDTLLLGIESLARRLAGTEAGDEGAVAVGEAEERAGTRLVAAVAETAATSGGPPLDAYASGLVTATLPAILQEVLDEKAAVDAADDAGTRELRAILGLSFVALAGVLAGVAAVLRAGRAGWMVLAVGWAIAGAAAVVAVLTAI